MEGWKESLPAEMQESGIVKNAETFEDFAKKAIGADSMLGRSISIPGVDATPEERASFDEKVSKHSDTLGNLDNKDDVLKKWGRPDDKSGYKGDPDKEYTIDMEALQSEAFSLALTQDQFFEMANSRQSMIDGLTSDNKTALDADRESIFEEWGASKADKLDNIDAYMDLMGADDGMKKAVRENMTSAQLRFFSKAAASVKGESIQAAKDKSSGADAMTPAEANEALSKVKNGDAYFDVTHPNHKHARLRALQLTDMAQGRQPKSEYGAPILQVQRQGHIIH